MATAANIIERAMRLLGQTPAADLPSTSEYADGLTALNALLDSWRNDELMCYATREETLTLSTGVASYTIGPSGTLNTTRPVAIDDAYIVDNSLSYGVQMITDQQYEGIILKSLSAPWPDRAWYQPTMPLGTLYVFPVPNATRTMKILTRTPLVAFAQADTVTLPPGWERALAAALAIDLAPEFQTSPSREVIAMAQGSKASIRAVNSRPIMATNEMAAVFNTGMFNIYTGQ